MEIRALQITPNNISHTVSLMIIYLTTWIIYFLVYLTDQGIFLSEDCRLLNFQGKSSNFCSVNLIKYISHPKLLMIKSILIWINFLWLLYWSKLDFNWRLHRIEFSGQLFKFLFLKLYKIRNASKIPGSCMKIFFESIFILLCFSKD